MPRTITILLFLFFTISGFCQLKNNIGQLKFINAKVIKIDTVREKICGITVTCPRLMIEARTKCQLSCNYGDPSKNSYDTVNNRLYVCYAYDSTEILHKAILSEIEQNVNDIHKENYRLLKHDTNDVEYQDYPLNASFFSKKNLTIPYIWSGEEGEGSFEIFYINKRVYKVIVAEGNGLGNLTLFTHQNVLFRQ